jgi:hypothetical protein
MGMPVRASLSSLKPLGLVLDSVVPGTTGLKDNDGVRGTLGATSFSKHASSGQSLRAGHLSNFSQVDLGSGRNTR